MTAVETSGALWLRDALGHEPGDTLSKADAHEVTAKIKAYAGVAWLLLLEAHKRQAHKAMGYPTWADYVSAEFDMSKSRSYQLISQAKVILELTEAVSTDVDVSTMVDISEREARDLAPVVHEAKAAVVEAVEALPADAPAEDKADAVRDALDRLRATAVEARRPKVAAGEDPSGDAGEVPTRLAPPAAPSRDASPAALIPTVDCPTCGGSGVVAAVSS